MKELGEIKRRDWGQFALLVFALICIFGASYLGYHYLVAKWAAL